ncbi:MAG: peptidoglycan-binding domain-containing protein [Candidatus Rokuibacteriota bacterium]
MQAFPMRALWSVAVIGVSGDGGLPARRESDSTPPAGSGMPASDAQTQRPPFVLEAQRALRDLGYHPGPIDGTFGPQTRSALEKYQLAEKLTVTGQLDAETMERLDVYKRLFRPAREL